MLVCTQPQQGHAQQRPALRSNGAAAPAPAATAAPLPPSAQLRRARTTQRHCPGATITCTGCHRQSSKLVRSTSCRRTISVERLVQRARRPARPSTAPPPACCRALEPGSNWSRNHKRCCANDSGRRLAGVHGRCNRRCLSALPACSAASTSATSPATRRILEQRAQRQLHSERLTHARYDLRRQQRMPAQLEEVVVDADPLHAAAPPPRCTDQQFLDRRPRGNEPASSRHSPGSLQRRQRRRSTFPLGVNGISSITTNTDGTMYSGSFARRYLRNSLSLQRLPLLPSPGRPPTASSSASSSRHHDRSLHCCMSAQDRFDLSQLNAIAAQLHLLVGSSQILHLPIARYRATSPVRYSRAPGRAAERVGMKRRAVSSGPLQITARQPLAADVQLPGHAHRHRLQVLVQHIHLRVRDWPPDRNRRRMHR